MDIIEVVQSPTDWVSAMVIIEKPNGKLRIPLAPRPHNPAIKRHHYQLPTAEELQKYLGMINYIGKFIPNLSHLIAPLRPLLGNETEFVM